MPRLAIALLALLMPLAACGDDDDEGPETLEERGVDDDADVEDEEPVGGEADDEGDNRFELDLEPLNESDASATAVLAVVGTMLEVTLDVEGVVADQTHAQHIHQLETGEEGTCPPADADEDGDGFVSVAEGGPFYGPVVLPFEPFPTADAEGTYRFEGSFELPDELASLDTGVMVVHGGEVDGEYDPSLPVLCAEIG